MSASNPSLPTPLPSPAKAFQRGFSLIELLIAVLLTSLLMAGMFNVFKATASSFQTGLETLGMQRSARWGLNLLQEEILDAGYLLPARIMNNMVIGATAQPPVLMQATDYTPAGATAPVDELQFIMDVPLGVEGTLNTAVPENGTILKLDIPSGGSLIKADDVAFIQDSSSAFMLVSSISASNEVTLKIAGDDYKAFTNTMGDDTANAGGMVDARMQKPHNISAPVTFIRPNQVVRYTVVPRALDPGDPAAMVPCLVRQTRPLATDPGTIWKPDFAVVQADEQILLEGVTGFRVDWSLDGGKNWIIKDGLSDGTWDKTREFIDKIIKDHTSKFVKQSKGVDDGGDPFYFNYLPVLIRLDVETRSRIQRTEYNATNPNAAAYRTRRETLMLSPRNFALGHP